jgi:hypothetical protein
MNRRGFLLGTLATGLAFTAKLVFAQSIPQCKDQIERFRRMIRLFYLPNSQLKKCRILYVLKDDNESYQMPSLQSVKVDRNRCEIQFIAEKLMVTHNRCFIGLRFLDDEGYELTMQVKKFFSEVSMNCGDSLIVTYTIGMGQTG